MFLAIARPNSTPSPRCLSSCSLGFEGRVQNLLQGELVKHQSCSNLDSALTVWPYSHAPSPPPPVWLPRVKQSPEGTTEEWQFSDASYLVPPTPTPRFHQSAKVEKGMVRPVFSQGNELLEETQPSLYKGLAAAEKK